MKIPIAPSLLFPELVYPQFAYGLEAYIKGPMTFTYDELYFLGTPWQGHCRPDFKLEKDVSDKLLTLLRANHNNTNIEFVT